MQHGQKMFSGSMTFDETDTPQPLSMCIGDRIPNQPTLVFNLVVTSLGANSNNCAIGGEFVVVAEGTPLRPGEQDPRVYQGISLDDIYAVGTVGQGISISYTASVQAVSHRLNAVPPVEVTDFGQPGLFSRPASRQTPFTQPEPPEAAQV